MILSMKMVHAFLNGLSEIVRGSYSQFRYPRVRLIYGGTFNPIHNTHVEVIRYLSVKFPDAVIHVMPNAYLPSTSSMPSPQTRLQMIRVALADMLATNGSAEHPMSSGVYLDETEQDIPYPSVTWQTAKKLMHQYPDDKIAWVVGSDVLLSLHRWPDWKKLFDYCHLYVIPRKEWLMPPHRSVLCYIDAMVGNENESSLRLFDDDSRGAFYSAQALRGCVFTDSQFPLSDVSSTMVRQMISDGVDCPHLHPDVFNIIRLNQLYTSDN